MPRFTLAQEYGNVGAAGYEASAHMSEETVAARSATPAAIIMSLGASYIIGLLLIIVLLFCVQVSVQAMPTRS